MSIKINHTNNSIELVSGGTSTTAELTPRVGEVREFASNPGAGWLPCDGSSYVRADYPVLESVMPDAYVASRLVMATYPILSDDSCFFDSGAGKHRAIAASSSGTTVHLESIDGLTWAVHPNPLPISITRWDNAVFGQTLSGVYYLVKAGSFYTTSDLTTAWTNLSSTLSTFLTTNGDTSPYAIHAINVSNIIYLVVKRRNTTVTSKVYYSTDYGVSWNFKTTSLSEPSGFLLAPFDGVQNDVFVISMSDTMPIQETYNFGLVYPQTGDKLGTVSKVATSSSDFYSPDYVTSMYLYGNAFTGDVIRSFNSYSYNTIQHKVGLSKTWVEPVTTLTNAYVFSATEPGDVIYVAYADMSTVVLPPGDPDEGAGFINWKAQKISVAGGGAGYDLWPSGAVEINGNLLVNTKDDFVFNITLDASRFSVPALNDTPSGKLYIYAGA